MSAPSDSEFEPSAAAIALGAFVLGAVAAVAVQFAARRMAQRRRSGRKMDELIVNRRYEPRPSRFAANDDPWGHYEDVLG
jgi:hypothetical protein